MANNTTLSTNVGIGDQINTTDGTTFTAISTTGKIPGSLIFTSTALAAAPTAVIDTRPLPVTCRNATGTLLGDATTPWQVSLANTAANATAVKVDGSAVTQPVSGTVTANIGTVNGLALDATLTGGTAKAIVRGGAKGTTAAADLTSNPIDLNTQALHVDGSKVTQPVSAASLPLPAGASTAAKQPALGIAGTASADVITVQGIAAMTALKVDGSAVTQPVSGTVSITANSSVNVSQMNGVTVTMGNGVAGTGVQRVAIASDNATITVNDAPVTTGGLSTSSFLSTAAVQSTAVKASAGMVYAIEFFNVGAAAVFVRLYNQATAPASTDGANIIWRGIVPGNTAGTGFVKTWDKGIAFAAGIGMRCTGAIADNDATVLVANQVIGNVDFK